MAVFILRGNMLRQLFIFSVKALIFCIILVKVMKRCFVVHFSKY